MKDTLSQLGMRVKFWKVAMKPGKPLIFGAIGNKPVFGLPGNPTSAMISFEQFVRPALLKMMGHANLFRPSVDAYLTEEVKIRSNRLHLIRCRLFEVDGKMMASVTGSQSSGAAAVDGPCRRPDDSAAKQENLSARGQGQSSNPSYQQSLEPTFTLFAGRGPVVETSRGAAIGHSYVLNTLAKQFRLL